MLQGAFAHSSEALAEFGLEPKKKRRPATAEEVLVSAAKLRATRAERRTMGKRQKAAIKGNVTGVVITPVTAPTDGAGGGSNGGGKIGRSVRQVSGGEEGFGGSHPRGAALAPSREAPGPRCRQGPGKVSQLTLSGERKPPGHKERQGRRAGGKAKTTHGFVFFPLNLLRLPGGPGVLAVDLLSRRRLCRDPGAAGRP